MPETVTIGKTVFKVDYELGMKRLIPTNLKKGESVNFSFGDMVDIDSQLRPEMQPKNPEKEKKLNELREKKSGEIKSALEVKDFDASRADDVRKFNEVKGLLGKDDQLRREFLPRPTIWNEEKKEFVKNENYSDEKYLATVESNIQSAISDPWLVNLPLHVRIMMGMNGVWKFEGEANNPFIMKIAKDMGIDLKDDESDDAQCALIMQYALWSSAQGENRSFDASKSGKLNQDISRLGTEFDYNERSKFDVVILPAEGDKPSHIAIYMGDDANGNARIFGGNQLYTGTYTDEDENGNKVARTVKSNGVGVLSVSQERLANAKFYSVPGVERTLDRKYNTTNVMEEFNGTDSYISGW
ncbi:MAG: hypothetical protein V4691_03565 [Pseudomonadota bacterium]